MNAPSTRARIVAAADRLFYQQGFEQTSFAHIAQAVGITRGNFYYHFKSKDDILDAVIAWRLGATGAMLARWEVEGGDAAGRLRCFIGILMANRDQIMAYGCPVGTLCSELAKLDHSAQPQATQLFALFRSWLRRQFELLGRGADADQLAMHLLARSQGVATLANAFHDEAFIRNEVDHLYQWLEGEHPCLS